MYKGGIQTNTITDKQAFVSRDLCVQRHIEPLIPQAPTLLCTDEPDKTTTKFCHPESDGGKRIFSREKFEVSCKVPEPLPKRQIVTSGIR